MIGSRLKRMEEEEEEAILPLDIPVLNLMFSPKFPDLTIFFPDPLATILREPWCSYSMAKKPLSVTNCMNDALARGNRRMSGSVNRGYVLFKVDFA